jgi:hypothetical protein
MFLDHATGQDGVNESTIVPGLGSLITERAFLGSEVPPYWETVDSRTQPVVTARQILIGQGATRPDRMIVGDWGTFPSVGTSASIWDYTPITDRPMTDHTVLVYWDPRTIQPGETRVITTYYGLANASEDFAFPYVLALQGPRALQYVAPGSQVGNVPAVGQPFTVTGYVYNLNTNVDLRNVGLFLFLQPGLALAAGESAQKNISVIGPRGEGQVSWQVVASGVPAGSIPYTLKASVEPTLAKQITNMINIPALPEVGVAEGWQMIAVPFEGFEVTEDQGVLYHWDSLKTRYSRVVTPRPGDGYWLLREDGGRLASAPGSTPAPLPGNLNGTFRIPLGEGWNQIGNPYLYGMVWGRINVLYKPEFGAQPLSEAIRRGWIRGTLFWYDTVTKSYNSTSSLDYELAPWVGYWVKALVPVELIVPPVDTIGAGINTASTVRSASGGRAAAQTAENWRLQLSAQAGKAADLNNYLGISRTASEGYDDLDAEKPPMIGDYVDLRFPHRDWGRDSGHYAKDIRSAGKGAMTWEIEVETVRPNTEVVITWPNISRLPKDYSFRLVDADTGKKLFMRTSAAYRYNSGQGGVRRLRIEVEPAGAAALMITNVVVNAPRNRSGAAAIAFNLSREATADVEVLTLTGKPVKKIAAGRAVTRGLNNLAWDYRDSKGRQVPGGAYLVQITATDGEGQVVKAVRPVSVP